MLPPFHRITFSGRRRETHRSSIRISYVVLPAKQYAATYTYYQTTTMYRCFSHAVITVSSERTFFQSIVIGPAGRTVQAITAEAKEDIEALLGCPVELTLNVRTRK